MKKGKVLYLTGVSVCFLFGAGFLLYSIATQNKLFSACCTPKAGFFTFVILGGVMQTVIYLLAIWGVLTVFAIPCAYYQPNTERERRYGCFLFFFSIVCSLGAIGYALCAVEGIGYRLLAVAFSIVFVSAGLAPVWSICLTKGTDLKRYQVPLVFFAGAVVLSFLLFTALWFFR